MPTDTYSAKLTLPELAAIITQSIKAARDAAGSLPWAPFEAVVTKTLTAHEKRAAANAEAVYEAYPRHVGRKSALAAITRAAKSTATMPGGGFEYLLERTRAYAEAVAKWAPGDRQFIPHPSTFFNQGRHADDPKEWLRHQTEPTARDYSKI